MTPGSRRTIRMLAIVLTPVAAVVTWAITSSFGLALGAAFVALVLVGLYAQIRYDLPGDADDAGSVDHTYDPY